MNVCKLLTLLATYAALASMDILRKRKENLLASCHDVQMTFQDYHRVAENSEETYIFRNKTILTHTSLSDKYLQTRLEYDIAWGKFRKLKKLYNCTKIYKRSDYAFIDDINVKMAQVIKAYRNNMQSQQYANELITDRDTVHDFTETLLTNDRLRYILGKGPNFIPTIHGNDIKSMQTETFKSVLEA